MKVNLLRVPYYDKLSDEIENYLKYLECEYHISYCHRDDNLPVIILKNSFSTFSGKQGFAIFKAIYKPSLKMIRIKKLKKLNIL